MNCRKAAEMVLNGKTNRDLEEHLSHCEECDGLRRTMQNIRLEHTSLRYRVPEQLDRAVLSFAAAQNKNKREPLVFSRFALRFCAAAAMLAVCILLGIISMTESIAEKPADVRPDANPISVAVSYALPQNQEAFLDTTASMDTELLTLAVELDRTASDLLTVASTSPAAWYSQNSSFDF